DVVITGWGCVSPLGGDASSTWAALMRGESARGEITCIPFEGCRVTQGAEAHLPELMGVSKKEVTRLSRASRLAIPAARQAMGEAGMLDGDGRSLFSRLELSISTTACGMEHGETFLRDIWSGKSQRLASKISRYPAHQQIGDLQQHLAFSGPSMIVSNACASGANAIGHAADLLRAGFADIVLAGGYEALCELVFCGFDSLQALDADLCKPFDLYRRGLMLGEGAAFLVMETSAHAIKRGAKIKGRLAGYGHTTDTHHITQPDPTGAPLENAIQHALQQAGLDPSEIGYLNAHGTATVFNDGAEAAAFVRVFGENLSGMRISSTKAAIGHTLGAAGTLEAIFALECLRTGDIPPQINTTHPIPELAACLAKPGDKLTKPAVLSVNLGFGGSNAALVFTVA
ncbi:MAG: beta-ketoacyl-[acyl-carrier-protein] synthase family protein, partial [Spartobacteria bacterium]